MPAWAARADTACARIWFARAMCLCHGHGALKVANVTFTATQARGDAAGSESTGPCRTVTQANGEMEARSDAASESPFKFVWAVLIEL